MFYWFMWLPPLPDALSNRLSPIIAGLCGAIAHYCVKNRSVAPALDPVPARLLRLRTQFAALVAKVR